MTADPLREALRETADRAHRVGCRPLNGVDAYFWSSDIKHCRNAECKAANAALATHAQPALDVEVLRDAMRDHCHDSADEGAPMFLRHTHLAPFVRDDCAEAIAARLQGQPET